MNINNELIKTSIDINTSPFYKEISELQRWIDDNNKLQDTTIPLPYEILDNIMEKIYSWDYSTNKNLPILLYKSLINIFHNTPVKIVYSIIHAQISKYNLLYHILYTFVETTSENIDNAILEEFFSLYFNVNTKYSFHLFIDILKELHTVIYNCNKNKDVNIESIIKDIVQKLTEYLQLSQLLVSCIDKKYFIYSTVSLYDIWINKQFIIPDIYTKDIEKNILEQDTKAVPSSPSASQYNTLNTIYEYIKDISDIFSYLYIENIINNKLNILNKDIISTIYIQLDNLETTYNTIYTQQQDNENDIYTIEKKQKEIIQEQENILKSLQIQEYLLKQHEENLQLQLYQIQGQLKQIRIDINDVIETIKCTKYTKYYLKKNNIIKKINYNKEYIDTLQSNITHLNYTPNTLYKFQNDMHKQYLIYKAKIQNDINSCYTKILSLLSVLTYLIIKNYQDNVVPDTLIQKITIIFIYQANIFKNDKEFLMRLLSLIKKIVPYSTEFYNIEKYIKKLIFNRCYIDQFNTNNFTTITTHTTHTTASANNYNNNTIFNKKNISTPYKSPQINTHNSKGTVNSLSKKRSTIQTNTSTSPTTSPTITPTTTPVIAPSTPANNKNNDLGNLSISKTYTNDKVSPSRQKSMGTNNATPSLYIKSKNTKRYQHNNQKYIDPDKFTVN